MKSFENVNGRLTMPSNKVSTPAPQPRKKPSRPPSKKDMLLIGDERQEMEYTLAKCCNPIAGDDVFGFVTIHDGIKVHRINCPNATEMMSNYAYRVMKARWASQEMVEFEVKLKFTGIDDVGLVHNITNIISSDMTVNMKGISFESIDGIFEGEVRVLVTDTEHLGLLIEKLKNVEGVLTVYRADSEMFR
ncbi:MAG: guanosine-3',5'-bis(diphosphate) 3'-pyrophosphohydrolase [Gammaproteobacteria bacterium]